MNGRLPRRKLVGGQRMHQSRSDQRMTLNVTAALRSRRCIDRNPSVRSFRAFLTRAQTKTLKIM
ncbi:hypothetical protein HW555_000002 [Spodoptera exigua]|uniref:Uncharacterized protein n=1 Tax=Spodoptera exigua TaxID=7107 RepID=A0A835GTL2_SPOEX|nr:hypothetical protein HW555_000002 [Spodoptera exigua]